MKTQSQPIAETVIGHFTISVYRTEIRGSRGGHKGYHKGYFMATIFHEPLDLEVMCLDGHDEDSPKSLADLRKEIIQDLGNKLAFFTDSMLPEFAADKVAEMYQQLCSSEADLN